MTATEKLRAFLAEREPEVLAYGIHWIVVQSSDGPVIIGDFHEYGATRDPFFRSEVETAILRLAYAVLEIPNREVVAGLLAPRLSSRRGG